MPPPSLNPQGSRAGLITAVVVLSILFVTSAIFAFYYSAEASKAQASVRTTTDKLNQYANADAQGDPAVQALLEAKSDPAFQGQSAIQVAMSRAKNLANAIAGTPDPKAAEARASQLVATASSKDMQQLGVTVAQGASLDNVVTGLAEKVKSLAGEIQSRDQKLNDAAEQHKKDLAQLAAIQSETAKTIQEQGQKLTEALAQLDASRQAGETTVAGVQKETVRALQESQEQAAQLTKQVADGATEIAKLKQDLAQAQGRIPRPAAAGETVIRQADAKIVRVPGNDNVFINIGYGDQVPIGMTFEVYDQTTGVPAPGGEETESALGTGGVAGQPTLPVGKASIEVVRLGEGQSECRIIRQSLGKPVIEGDVVANLVWDKNTKYNFVVFGNFDLDQNGTPTSQDAETVKRLITQWGGKLQSDVNVDSDFVVLGKEPEVPVLDENPDPTQLAQQAAAKQQLEAYQNLINKAKDLHVPILNQNRFLYYTGYYEQAQR
jgi:hypothetical protein